MEMTIVRAATLCFLVFMLVQFVASMISGVRGRWISQNAGIALLGAIWLVFDLARRELHVVFDARIIGALTTAIALFFLGRKALRGERWSSAEANLIAFACIGAALTLGSLAAGIFLMLIADVAAAVATVLFVREVSGSSAPAR